MYFSHGGLLQCFTGVDYAVVQEMRHVLFDRNVSRANSSPEGKVAVPAPGQNSPTSPIVIQPPSPNVRMLTFRAQSKLWQERSDVINLGLLQQLNVKDVNRQQALFELIDSEKAYLRDVDTLLVVCISGRTISTYRNADYYFFMFWCSALLSFYFRFT